MLSKSNGFLAELEGKPLNPFCMLYNKMEKKMIPSNESSLDDKRTNISDEQKSYSKIEQKPEKETSHSKLQRSKN